MTQSPTSCSSSLLAVQKPGADNAAVVRYSSTGALLIVDPDHDQLDFLRQVTGLNRTLILREDAAVSGQNPGDAALHIVQGEAKELHGWLGRFQVRAVDAQANMLTGLSAKGSGAFDMVIDCRARPLLDRSVPPYGYFRATSVSDLEDALCAAQKLIGNFEKPKYFQYDPSICTHQAFGQTGCTRCIDVCGAVAIRSGGPQIEVNPYLCQGCGSCTLACPTGALSFVEPNRDELLETLRARSPGTGGEAKRLIVSDGALHSADGTEAAEHLVVRPLTAFGEELWLAAVALGYRQVILHTTCVLEPLTAALLHSKLETMRQMLPALGQPEEAVVFSDSESSLRALLDVPISESDSAKAAALPLATRSKRTLLVSALAAVDSIDSAASIALPAGSAIGEIVIDRERCTLCSSCAKTCPTGAIDYSERTEPGTGVLSFLEGSCVQCGICASGCPEDAIVLVPRLAPIAERTKRRIISSGPMAACTDCGVQFVAEQLLQRTLERLRETNATEALLEQALRCPRCRAVRVG